MTLKARAPSSDEAIIAGFVADMVEAWNRGSGEGFAAHFAGHADFIAFDGTHLEGRQQIVDFHQKLFDTLLKGTRLWGEVKFVRIIDAQLAIMHAYAGMTPAGALEPLRSRDSMQLFVVTRSGGTWQVTALLNARKITLEQQYFADEVEELSPQGRIQLNALLGDLGKADSPS